MVHPSVTTVTELILVRAVFALGASATTSMLTSLLGDYPTDQTRGRTAGIMGLMSGIGALVGILSILLNYSTFRLGVFVFVRIPTWVNGGPHVDGQIMYWAAGGTILISASVVFCGLSDKIVKENKVSNVDLQCSLS